MRNDAFALALEGRVKKIDCLGGGGGGGGIQALLGETNRTKFQRTRSLKEKIGSVPQRVHVFQVAGCTVAMSAQSQAVMMETVFVRVVG